MRGAMRSHEIHCPPCAVTNDRECDMLTYKAHLKAKARELRSSMTESERLLWSRLRRRRVLGVQFSRQKPIGDYIVDFYAPRANSWWK